MKSALIVDPSRSHNMYIRDWRQALRSPPTYRLGNRSFRFHFHAALLVFALGALFFIFFYVRPNSTSYSDNWLARNAASSQYYNATYPLTPPIVTNGVYTYRIGIIADLDTDSKSKTELNIWRSYLKKGYLSYTPSKRTVSVAWDSVEPVELKSGFSLKGRGMELSDLIVFNGKLLSFDDRTGIIYEIEQDKAYPWVLMTDGDGHLNKGFKAEWATVKDRQLYVGSMGKEWTTSAGEYENENPMHVKVVSPTGEIKHINWINNYKAIREVIGIKWPGYMIHESGMWSDYHRRWYFLPRRCSHEKYNETRDELMGCNYLISTDEYFVDIKSSKVGKIIPSHGFSSFKFIPGTNDNVIVALKTEELNGKTATYITAFTQSGEILLKEEKIPTNLKYEGIEFI